jgi:hypothetical protein
VDSLSSDKGTKQGKGGELFDGATTNLWWAMLSLYAAQWQFHARPPESEGQRSHEQSDLVPAAQSHSLSQRAALYVSECEFL